MSDTGTSKKRRYLKGGALAVIGWILSPLTWWNDLFINIPIAYGFAWLFSLVHKPLFLPMFITGYWITNILGLFLLHKGVVTTIAGEKHTYTRKDFIKDVIISVIYTAAIILLVQFKVLKPPQEYLFALSYIA